MQIQKKQKKNLLVHFVSDQDIMHAHEAGYQYMKSDYSMIKLFLWFLFCFQELSFCPGIGDWRGTAEPRKLFP